MVIIVEWGEHAFFYRLKQLSKIEIDLSRQNEKNSDIWNKNIE